MRVRGTCINDVQTVSFGCFWPSRHQVLALMREDVKEKICVQLWGESVSWASPWDFYTKVFESCLLLRGGIEGGD